MDLFGYQESDTQLNLLPVDGQVNYFGPVFADFAEQDFNQLMSDVVWQPDRVNMFGKEIVMSRQYAWYGDNAYVYHYSGSSRKARLMPDYIQSIKDRIENITGAQFNACLLNRYDDGSQGMGWHADNEPEIVQGMSIASISLGAERRFDFKHRTTKQKVSIVLENGSLLLMDAESQRHWLHQLPKTTKVTEPRINLTFRAMHDWTIARSP